MASKVKRTTAAIVIRGVDFKEYAKLSAIPGNRHLRMAYHDGILEIVSPKLRKHEIPSGRLRIIITTVADHLGLLYDGTGSYTYRRSGSGPKLGMGKEPDQSFYFANVGRVPRDPDPDLDAGDPPPDLWVEVDNRISSSARLPVYAALGVPEIWRYRKRNKQSIEFLRLKEGSYESIDRSLSLPVLTPDLVLEALELGGDLPESEWLRRLRAWVLQTFPTLPSGG